MYVCVYVCMYSMYAYMYVYLRTYVCLYVCMYVCILKYMKPAMCMCVCVGNRAIRAGDCLGMLVEFFYANRQMEEAYKYLREVLYILPLLALHTYIHTHTY